MANAEELEVYRQRYETYRHLDKLRWQMVQISVAIAPLILAFGAKEDGDPAWWVLGIVGILLFTFGSVMERIRHGIHANAVVLSDVGKSVGDTNIPTTNKNFGSTSFGVSVLIRVLGVVTLLLGALKWWEYYA